jgi:hypothetical protein
MPIPEEEIKELISKYKGKLDAGTVAPGQAVESKPITSLEYKEFKENYMPKHMSFYEKLCNFSEKIIKLKPDEKRWKELEDNIKICHLNITPAGVVSASYFLPVAFILITVFLSFAIPSALGGSPSTFFMFISLTVGAILIFPLSKFPDFLANKWRMKSSNQMVLCIFYVVTYMRHTSNIERAIEFASEHLSPPLSLDLKKVLWDVETEKYESVKDSLESYLETWKKWNMEFIESFHLIESSLYEGAEERRVGILDKSLTVILEETYEKMLHYAQNLKSPITMLHMLGIILPILGLVILPLVVSFMEGVTWYHLAVFYNIILPAGVYYLTTNILSKRPTGYGEVDIAEANPQLKKYKKIRLKFLGAEINFTPLVVSLIIAGILFVCSFSPLVLHKVIPDDKWDIGFLLKSPYIMIIDQSTTPKQVENIQFKFLEYRESRNTPGLLLGPYGLGAAIASLALPLALGLGVGIYYRIRSKSVMEIRENIKKLEQEFASALFQLGNRLADGLPAEIAFEKVASVTAGTTSGTFFNAVMMNIKRLGFSVEQAIFDPRLGAILNYPSPLIDSSMKVLVESSKRGPIIAANAIINISTYIKEIHKVDERLKDLMADVISDMKSQISFLTPAISGIVIGITSMITTIIGRLGEQLSKIQTGAAAGEAIPGGGGGLMDLFGDGIPTFYFQIIVGIYVVQIVYILTVMANGVENGADKLNEEYMLGNNMIRSTVMYVFFSLAIMIIFNIVAGSILKSSIG